MALQAPPQEREVAERISALVKRWEDGVGKDFRLKCERFYRQYRGFKRWDSEWTKQHANDRDLPSGGYLYGARKEWGANLHIPMSFRTIESVVPRAIAQAPKLLIRPRDEEWMENARSVQLLIDSQQEQIDIDLPFQAVMRSGQMYGLGVGKTFWDKRVHYRRRMEQRTIPRPQALGGTHKLGDRKEEVLFDDPRFEDVDSFDFLWDPYGYDMHSCEWTGQRIWLSLRGVLERLAQNGGPWDSETAALLDEEEVRKLPGAQQRYDEIWQNRMQESGFNNRSMTEHGEQIHEVLEFHDGERVWTILDRSLLVREAENPCGEMPFQVYRPTPLQHQMVGIGALEPLEHLQRELDTLRSQRRDLVTLALCAGYAYDATAVDPEDLTFGPAAAIEVDGDPRSALMPLQVREVPGSGYQEEAAINANIESVAGLADALDNSPGGTSTATEAQLVQAAVGRRIELGARRFEIEVARQVARQFLYLNQHMIAEERTLTVPGAEEPFDPEAARHKWVKLGPGDLEGEFEFQVEGGSLAARNIPQDRADAAQLFNTLSGDWFTNPTKVRERFYELMGIKHPHAWLRSPEPSVPLMALRFLVQAGVDPALISRAALHAREVSAPEEQQGAEQVAPMSQGAPTR